VTSLLSRLVPVWGELGPTQGEGLRHALFRLALSFCCLDTKSTSPIVKWVRVGARIRIRFRER